MRTYVPAAKTILAQPLDLPCGAQLKNRLIKAAMSDSLGDGEGNPTQTQMRLYERWAEGGAALTIIGEVQTTPDFPEKPGNLVLALGANTTMLQKLATRGSVNNADIWPQLGHAGALSHGPISKPKGPSSLNVSGLRCEGMALAEIEELPENYARAAALARKVGFKGVQIHAGHGFLFSQFLSPLFNHRTDAYGGSVAGRFRVIAETIHAVRHAVGEAFPIGIRINATDKLVGGLTEDEALQVVRLLDRTSIDLIDVSGGTYFPGAPSSSDSAAGSGPYFLSFAKRAKAITSIPIMLTGGFKTREEAVSAIDTGTADAVGLARSMVLDPALPNNWLGEPHNDPKFPRFDATVPGGVTAWYSMRLTALGEDNETSFKQSLPAALEAYEARDAERCTRWQEKFS
ncbi:oxidoreductase [uncultured Shimia sp.]|uniref:oxidoreductase n=1 Tax=uncultured Shimia sp. TaxID=573152 RepID=UPI002634D13F|nr:oxidoreductase [uncultured Shimia sp.]